MLTGVAAGAADCKVGDMSKAAQVAQKSLLLQRLLADSEPVRRAESSGNPQALAGIAAAREILRDAQAALRKGRSPRGAGCAKALDRR